MMKRHLNNSLRALFLSLAVLLSLPMLAEQVEINGINYELIAKAKQATVIKKSSGKYSGEIVIPESVEHGGTAYSVTSIGDYAFQSCSGLTSVTIPNSVTSIGDEAFEFCSGLTSVHISDIAAWCNIDFGYFDSNPLYYAHHLYMNGEEIKDLVIPNSVTSIGEKAFRNCTGLTSVTIPNSVESIGNDAFYNCSGLTSVTIGNSVTSIGNNAFSGCSGLTSVTIPNSVTSIGGSAFTGCSGLTSVTIGNSVTSIGDEAFEFCSGLTSVTIPNSVTSIESEAFARCPELLDVYCLAEKVPSTYSDAFNGSYPEYATLHVPDASVDSYKATSPWSSFGKIMTLDGNVPNTKTCATPTISYKDGQLICTSETEGATVTTTITSADFTSFSTETIDLTATYNITAIAKKTGYMDSETATATLCWITGELSNPTGVENIEAHHAVMITSANGVVTVSGVNDGTTVAVYTADGSMAGQATANNNTATITTNIEKGTVAIIKISDKAIKIVMK